jgi:mono/diheme cytochrome c family protein
MFVNYCAPCHGLDGKGDGPAADALKTLPADLTYLTKMNHGVFPDAHASSVIRGQAGKFSAHGSKEMPVWGTLFFQASGGQAAEVQQRVANLVEYLKTIQAK